MKYFLKSLSIVGLVLITTACTSQQKAEEKQLNQNIQAQKPADTPEQIADRAAMAFSNVEGLTPEQKLKLSNIYKNVYLESMKIRREIGQSKSLLFMTLAKVDYKAKDITNLKKKIVELDQRRLNLMFEALDDVQNVVGRGVEAEKIYKHLEDYEMPRHWIKDYTY